MDSTWIVCLILVGPNQVRKKTQVKMYGKSDSKFPGNENDFKSLTILLPCNQENDHITTT